MDFHEIITQRNIQYVVKTNKILICYCNNKNYTKNGKKIEMIMIFLN